MKTNNKYYNPIELDLLIDLFENKQWGLINVHIKVTLDERNNVINKKNKYKMKEFKERLDELDLDIARYRLLSIKYGIYY